MSGVIYPCEESNRSQPTEEELEHQSFNNKMIYQMLIRISKDPTVPANIRTKVHKTIMHAKVQQSAQIHTPNGVLEVQMLLGLNNLKAPEFTYDEQKTVTKLVAERLLDLLTELQAHENQRIEKKEANDKVLMELRDNLSKTMNTYAKTLCEYHEILESMKALRVETLPEVYKGKEQQTKLQHQINDLKAKMLEHGVQIHFLTENEESLGAYKEFVKSIKEEQTKVAIEIERMKDLKVKYKIADCEEYRQVLKEYLEYQTALEKFERMQKLMNNK